MFHALANRQVTVVANDIPHVRICAPALLSAGPHRPHLHIVVQIWIAPRFCSGFNVVRELVNEVRQQVHGALAMRTIREIKKEGRHCQLHILRSRMSAFAKKLIHAAAKAAVNGWQRTTQSKTLWHIGSEKRFQ